LASRGWDCSTVHDPSTYCNWAQVKCDNNLAVVGIFFQPNFAQVSLKGTIPTSIALLSSLTSLIWYSAGVTGIIPTEIGLLRNLQYLDLGFNSLIGTIPTQIGLLSKLSGLNLQSVSGLTGAIPTSLCNLPFKKEDGGLSLWFDHGLGCYPLCFTKIWGFNIYDDMTAMNVKWCPSSAPTTTQTVSPTSQPSVAESKKGKHTSPTAGKKAKYAPPSITKKGKTGNGGKKEKV